MSIVSAVDPHLRPPRRRVTVQEWLAIPEEKRAEVIDGKLVYHAMPGPKHGTTQSGILSFVRSPFHRRPGTARGPGGWWISAEVDMEIAGLLCRPDAVGWRRDKYLTLPEPDARGVVTAVPDWIAEVLSPSTAQYDLGAKRQGYHRAGVSHYWLVDPQNGTLTVLRWTQEDYLVVLAAGRGEVIRAAPFEAVEIDVGEVFGDDEPLPEAAPQPSDET
jgi:Uma2 family endonuclease